MAFFQTPPELGNQYDEDPVLASWLTRHLPEDVLRENLSDLREVGALAAGELHRSLLATQDDEPRLVQWDAWGQRVDRIELTAHWQKVAPIAASKGLIATAYERRFAEHSRIVQFALLYVLEPSTAIYSCPLAMTDGAAKTLLVSGNEALKRRALPRLTSRDPAVAWTSGQWMTERTGGSDVAISETVARRGTDGEFRLYGTKWFTSATTSQMALTLARPDANPPGGKGLALFYVEQRDEDGRLNGISVNRLKDKLGTRMVPTAELTLEGTRASLVYGETDGIKNITPMLNITRTWNAVGAACGMRRAVALARDYARRRVAFGAPLAEKPLHVDTLAAMDAEYQGAFMLTFRAVELLGREEAGVLTEDEAALLRLVTPLAKLTTGKQAVAVASEALESFGGAGYVEDTGLPRLLRDAQVLPIWEGTTNVLSLDVLRALGRSGSAAPLDPIEREVRRCVAGAAKAGCEEAGRVATAAVAHARTWLEETFPRGRAALEGGARGFALTLGRALELALLIDEAAWQAERGDRRAAAAARRLARHGVDAIADAGVEGDTQLLAGG